MKTKPLGIYVHIPFCVRKCLYCDFLSGSFSQDQQREYCKALMEEIRAEASAYQDYEVPTIFFGGGTPSLLETELFISILQTIKQNFSIARTMEITVEVNPGTVTVEKLSAYFDSGVNRLSIGVQSLQDKELSALGRIHTAEDFYRTFEGACQAGFQNISVDLMSGIPDQTKESYQATLKKVLSLGSELKHISAYSLIVEEGTPFYENTPPLPDEELDRELYHLTGQVLLKHGFERYEISNYAKPGYESRHNQSYWTRGEYLGVGLGSASLINNVRFHNTRAFQSYIAGGFHQKEEVEVLSAKEQMEEFMFLGLRRRQGVSREQFKACFGKELYSVYPGIVEKQIRQGLLAEAGDRIFLTELGIDVSNRVMAEYLLDA